MNKLVVFIIVMVLVSYMAYGVKSAGEKVLSNNVGRTETMLADLEL